MQREEVREIIECLGGEKRVYHYFKDRYCLDQLEHEFVKEHSDEMAIADLRKGSCARYLNKPFIKEKLKMFGNGRVNKRDLQLFWPQNSEQFVLGLSGWGYGRKYQDQTTLDKRNLVLRLGFNKKHLVDYYRLVRPMYPRGPFEYWGHPVSRGTRKTLSWVRMDVSLSTNEVLIEEVQNDWLRKANRDLVYAKKRRSKVEEGKLSGVLPDARARYEDLEYYVETLLAPYRDIWAEASLAAAIRFIRNDLGIENIYYHSFDTGTKIKRVEGKPPLSMYTSLPKQFGFKLVKEAPRFVVEDKIGKRYLKAIKEPLWFYLA